MMLRGLAFGLVCVLGCSKGSSAEATGPAGVVVELSGEVQASRAGQSRPLAVDAEVFADDTIKTAAASSVAIKLNHNNAALRLDADMTRRVDQSLAWKAPKQQDDSVLEGRDIDDQTAAAGRHTEHEAAATASNARADEAPVAAADKAPAPPAAPAPVKAPAKAKAPEPERERDIEKRKPVVRRSPPPPRPDKPRRDEVAPGGGGARGGGNDDGGGAHQSGRVTESTSASSAGPPLSRGGPIDVNKKIGGKVTVCHALADGAPAGSITVIVTVSASGAVSIKSIKPSTPALAKVAACARGKISALKLAGARPGSYTIAVKLK